MNSGTHQAGIARSAAALLVGIVFGVGLAIAQMTDPRKVLGFLDLAGDWDASLLLVLGAGVIVATVCFHFVLQRRAPLLDDSFHLPTATATAIDGPLVVGSILFGIGWGLAGYCPGPAVASLGLGNPEALWVVPAMLAGAALQRHRQRRRNAASSAAAPWNAK